MVANGRVANKWHKIHYRVYEDGDIIDEGDHWFYGSDGRTSSDFGAEWGKKYTIKAETEEDEDEESDWHN